MTELDEVSTGTGNLFTRRVPIFLVLPIATVILDVPTVRRISDPAGFRLLLIQVFDYGDFVVRLVVYQLIHEGFGESDSVAAGTQTLFFASFAVRHWILGLAGDGRMHYSGGVKSLPRISDTTHDKFAGAQVINLSLRFGIQLSAPFNGVH